MEIRDFIDKYDIEYTHNVISADAIEFYEKKINVIFGKELKEYILKYGYMAYKSIELYGINCKQGEKSDMISQTVYIHKYFPESLPYISLANLGDGEYLMISDRDDVYIFDSVKRGFHSTGKKLFEYLMDLFVKNQ